MLAEILGPVRPHEEAWDAVLRAMSDTKCSSLDDVQNTTKIRVIVTWIARSGIKSMALFLEALMDRWTDPKYIKFSLYAHQFGTSANTQWSFRS